MAKQVLMITALVLTEDLEATGVETDHAKVVQEQLHMDLMTMEWSLDLDDEFTLMLMRAKLMVHTCM